MKTQIALHPRLRDLNWESLTGGKAAQDDYSLAYSKWL